MRGEVRDGRRASLIRELPEHEGEGLTPPDALGAEALPDQERDVARRGLVLDYYLEVLAYKPGALAGSTALARARAGGASTEAHDRFWSVARRRLGDRDGTRALIEVLLLHRSLDAASVANGTERALLAGSCSADVVAIEARRLAERSPVAWQSVRASRASTAPPRPPPHTTSCGGHALTKMTDTAALAAIGAATRELRLPVVRADAGRIAEIAQRSQHSYLAFLAEVFSAEVDERSERRHVGVVCLPGFRRARRAAR